MRARLICSLTVSAVVLAACASTDPGVTATRSRDATRTQLIPTDTVPLGDPPPISTAPLPVEAGIIDFGESKPPQAYDGFLIASFKDLDAFWTEEFPVVYGADYIPLEGGVFAAYSGRTEPIPGCGANETTFGDVEGNAFYCSLGDFMVYDDEVLLPDLVDSLGEAAVAIVLAHEFGHAIQFRSDEFFVQSTILKEQQADCFAGAWAAHIARGESDVITFSDNEVKAGLVAMLQVADPVELGGSGDEDAHGTGFDRVGAFQDGFKGGAERCKSFFEEGRQLVDIPFDSTDINAGNLPLIADDGRDIITLLPADLTRFWTGELAESGITFTPPTVRLYPGSGPFPPCDGVGDDRYPENSFFCESTNEVMIDQDFALSLSTDPLLGDMSIGYLLAQGFSEAVQVAQESALQGELRALFDDCLTGSWVSDIVPPTPEGRELSLSAGDLDEAVTIAIIRADASSDTNVRGSAFEKIDSFRVGVLGGVDACAATLG